MYQLNFKTAQIASFFLEFTRPVMFAAIVGLLDYYDGPIVITSAWRSQQVNRAVGGLAGSLHLYGLAVDIRTRGADVPGLKRAFKLAGLGQNYRLIDEGNHLHLQFDRYDR